MSAATLKVDFTGRYVPPASEPGSNVCRVLYIPSDRQFVAAVDELLSILMEPDAWEDSGIGSDVSRMLAGTMFTDYLLSECISPGGDAVNLPITLWQDSARIVAGSTWEYTIRDSQAYQFCFQQTTAADGDIFEHDFSCPVGTYTLHLLARKIAAGADVTMKIDTDTIGTVNLNNGALIANYHHTWTGINLTDGEHILRGEISDGGSNDYVASITKFWLEKTS